MMNDRFLSMCEAGNSIVVRKLIKAKVVDINFKDETRETGLLKACKGGHYDVAKLLLEAGAEHTTPSNNLVYPLHFAAKNDDEDLVKLLVAHGAQVDVTNKNGLLPIDYTTYDSDTRDILTARANGIIPEIEEISEVPLIPDFAIEGGQQVKTKKKGGKKKGKKGGKKKGKKKKKKK